MTKSLDSMIKKWYRVKSEQLASSRVFSMRRDTSISPLTGAEHDFYVVDPPDWINVVALTEAGEIVLIEQYRHGMQSVTIEIPGGMIDPGESPLDAAKRELLEETGYASEDWAQIGCVHPNPAIQSNSCYTFLARGARKVQETKFDSTEDICTLLEPAGNIPKLAAAGAITHALVVAAFYWYSIYTMRDS
ncbi:MAG: NUDIX hydrolase [Deltaproteobacteria bacterium]